MKRPMMLSIFALFTQGCGFTLYAASQPPATKTAEIDDERNYITISRGIGLAIACTQLEEHGCDGLELSAEDASLVDILPAYLANASNVTARDPETGQPTQTYVTQKNVFVVVAKKSGSTDFHARSNKGNALYRLVVTDR